MTVIQSQNLALKDVRLGHAGALYDIFKQPGFFYAYTHQDNAFLPFSALKYAALGEISRLQTPRRHYLMGIFKKNEDELIGAAILTEIRETPDFGREAQIGYFVDVRHQQQGHATEAALAMKDFAKNDLGINNLYGMADPENVYSWKILEKLGLDFVKHEEVSAYKKRDGTTASRLHFRAFI